MSAPAYAPTRAVPLTSALRAAHAATRRIAPVWPLDKSVAVNPWWHWRDRPMAQVSARLGGLRNVRLLMPKAYYRRQWQAAIAPEHLNAAARELGVAASPQVLVDYLNGADDLPQWKNLSDWLDEQPEQATKMPWRSEITQQISQSCGLFLSYPERHPQELLASGGFYRFWRDIIRQDTGLAILMDAPELHAFFLGLPESPMEVISHVYRELQTQTVIDEDSFENYCLALLLDVNGWAAVFAGNAATQADALGENPQAGGLPVLNTLGDLLAVRLAWEWALWWRLGQVSTNSALRSRFAEQFIQSSLREAKCHQDQQYLWVWQRALELGVQAGFVEQLVSAEPSVPNAPALQAVFCIDVRSEPMRRALESVSPDIQTIGFAGFFGLPIEYQPFASDLKRPQLPALLKASISARPVLLQGHQRRQLKPLLRQRAYQHTGEQASATFGWVEVKGIFDSVRLLTQSFGHGHQPNPLNRFEDISGWQLWRGDHQLNPAEIAQMLAGVLQHMGLTKGFAARVLLVAHASCTANNAMAASLDCGACGGQSGEVNVRVLAYALNLSPVREALASHGIVIPAATRFIPCLHNTTTDDIQWFAGPGESLDGASDGAIAHDGAGAKGDDKTWQSWLKSAADRARAGRAAAMTITTTDPKQRERAFAQLTRDWAQLRPEWGLANNAAFVVAPRAATRSLNLGGRAFLHDYQWQSDKDLATLELIITAPMVVTQWINLQYYASMTDTQHYGSGNKLLHNVVGGNLGVFEGNGGDLRIGLPLQSLHDGHDWRHQPVRLNVYLAAPRQAIATIIQRHADIAALVNNDWLYVFQWDIEERRVSRYYGGQWLALNEQSAHTAGGNL